MSCMFFCPGCDKVISSYAKSCPTCGFPVADFLEDHNLKDLNKVWICTKCAKCYGKYYKYPICEYCNTPVVQTDIDNDIVSKKSANLSDNEYGEYTIQLAKEYGNNFDHNLFLQRIKKRDQDLQNYINEIDKKQSTQPTQPSNVPHCPTCGSTNIKKISATSKAVGAGLFGLFSKTARSQFECKSCGYKW